MARPPRNGLPAAPPGRSGPRKRGKLPTPWRFGSRKLAAAEAALRAARAALRNAERDLERTEVRAPRAGLVAARSAEVGEWAAPGRALLELLSIGAAEVRVALPDAAAGLLDLPFGNAPAARRRAPA